MNLAIDINALISGVLAIVGGGLWAHVARVDRRRQAEREEQKQALLRMHKEQKEALTTTHRDLCTKIEEVKSNVREIRRKMVTEDRCIERREACGTLIQKNQCTIKSSVQGLRHDFEHHSHETLPPDAKVTRA